MIRFADPDGFAEFGVTTNFSFLRGASHPEELVAQAIVLGLAAIGIADRNSLAGIVRAHLFLRHNANDAKGLRVVSGARLVFCDGTPDILAYPRDRAAYGRLCRLLTTGNIRAEKGTCRLMLEDLLDWQEGMQLIVLAGSTFDAEVEGRVAGRRFVEFEAEEAKSSAAEAKSSGPEKCKPFVIFNADREDPPPPCGATTASSPSNNPPSSAWQKSPPAASGSACR